MNKSLKNLNNPYKKARKKARNCTSYHKPIIHRCHFSSFNLIFFFFKAQITISRFYVLKYYVLSLVFSIHFGAFFKNSWLFQVFCNEITGIDSAYCNAKHWHYNVKECRTLNPVLLFSNSLHTFKECGFLSCFIFFSKILEFSNITSIFGISMYRMYQNEYKQAYMFGPSRH